MKRIGFYAGSFDPFTRGHLAVVCEALCSFDTVIVGIGYNSDKQPLFSAEERKELVLRAVDDFKQSYLHRRLNGVHFSAAEERAFNRLEKDEGCVKIIFYGDLTVDAALRCGATALIRGERPVGDNDSEMKLSIMNRELLAVRRRHLDMAMIPVPDIKLSYVSSSAVKSLCAAGEYVAAMKYVTPSVHQALVAHYLKKHYAAHFGNKNAERWEVLQKAYSDQRSYHTLSHVAYCLNYADIFYNMTERFCNCDCLKLAIYWHDFYCGQPDAEEKSADEAVKWDNSLGIIDTEHVRELIMATGHDGGQHGYNETCQVIHDVDLAILGDTDNYGTYAMQVRQEYARYGTEEYARGRIAVLERFLNGDYLYHTEFFREMFAETAEMNMRREAAFWQSLL